MEVLDRSEGQRKKKRGGRERAVKRREGGRFGAK